MSTEMCTQCGMPRSDHQPIAQFCPVGHWDFSKTDTFAAPAPEVPIAPSKENAPITWPCTGCGDSHAQGEGCFAAPAPEIQGSKSYFEKMRDAITPELSDKIVREVEEQFRPAPEVQGTPTKSNVAHQPWCASAPRPMDVPMGRGPYPCDCGTVKASPAPVGTPQKETPPKFTNRRGKPCSQACYEGRHAECTETYVTCNCTFRGSHTTVHAYATFTEKAAPVPEGVQGKEPQTFEQFWKVEKEALLARVVCGCSAGSTCDSSAVHVDKFAKEVFVSGEAAGRRSAITEAQESMKKRAADAVKDGNCASEGCAGCCEVRSCGAIAAGKIEELPILECAELQEKTK